MQHRWKVSTSACFVVLGLAGITTDTLQTMEELLLEVGYDCLLPKCTHVYSSEAGAQMCCCQACAAPASACTATNQYELFLCFSSIDQQQPTTATDVLLN
jgi:hypothetical protein